MILRKLYNEIEYYVKTCVCRRHYTEVEKQCSFFKISYKRTEHSIDLNRIRKRNVNNKVINSKVINARALDL
jgi:hypothetical protein